MKRHRIIVVVVLVIAIAMLYQLRRNAAPESTAADGPAVAVQAPDRSSADGAARRSPSPVSNVASSALPTPTATLAPMTQAFENAPDLDALAASLEARVAAGDIEAIDGLFRIARECSTAIAFRDRQHFETLRSWAAERPAQYRSTALRHAQRHESRCAGLTRSGRLSSERIKALDRQRLGADDLLGLAYRLVEQPEAMSLTERNDALRRIFASRNGDAIFILGDGMAWTGEGPGLLASFAGQQSDVIAWKLVGCDLGAACGPDSALLRQSCLNHNLCVAGDYRAFAQDYLLAPAYFRNALDAERQIIAALRDGTTEAWLPAE